MKPLDEEIYRIIDKGLEGAGLLPEETLKLYALPEDSREAALLRWAGQQLSLKAANGKAEVHAQA